MKNIAGTYTIDELEEDFGSIIKDSKTEKIVSKPEKNIRGWKRYCNLIKKPVRKTEKLLRMAKEYSECVNDPYAEIRYVELVGNAYKIAAKVVAKQDAEAGKIARSKEIRARKTLIKSQEDASQAYENEVQETWGNGNLESPIEELSTIALAEYYSKECEPISMDNKISNDRKAEIAERRANRVVASYAK